MIHPFPMLVHYLPCAYLGGMEQAALNLAKGLASLGISQELVVLGTQGPIVREFERLGIPTQVLGYSGPQSKYMPSIYARSFIALSKRKAHVVLLHGIHFVPLVTSLLLPPTTKVALQTHYPIELSIRRRWRYIVLHTLFGRRVQVFLCDSLFMSSNLMSIGVPKDRIAIVPQAVDLSLFYPSETQRREMRHRLGISEDAFVVIFAGWFTPNKDPMVLLEAFALLTRKFIRRNLHLLLCGDGPLRSQMVDFVNRNGLFDYCKFLGFVSNFADYLRCADAIVLTSRLESAGRVLLEAMATGVAVVSVRPYGGTAEIVRDGETGVLLDTRDPREIAESLECLAYNTSLREHLVRTARDYVKNHHGLATVAQTFCSSVGLACQ